MNGVLVRRNLSVTVRRFRSLLVALGVGAGLLLSMTGVVRSATESAVSLNTDSSLSILEVPAQDKQGQNPPLTGAAIKRMTALPGVEQAFPYAQFGLTVTDAHGADRGGVLWATPRIRWVQPSVVSPAAWAGSRPLNPREVIVPDTYMGESYASLVGQTVTATYMLKTGAAQGEGRQMALHVVAAYDNSSPGGDGESAMYVDPETFRTLALASVGVASANSSADVPYSAVYLKARTSGELENLQKSLSAMGFRSSNLATAAHDLPGLIGLMQRALPVLASVLLLLGGGLGAALASTWGHLRRWEVGLLSALGWSRRRIAATLGGELLLVGLVTSAAAVLLGSVGGLIWARVSPGAGLLPVGSVPAIPPLTWLVGVLLGLPLVMLVGGVARVLRLSRIEPAVALRRRD